MEEGYKNWSIVRKLLVDNRLEHAALLAHSIGVSPTMFAARARTAIGRIELKIIDAVHEAEQARADLEEQLEQAITKEEAKQAEQPSVAVTLDRVTDEPPKEGT